MNLKSGFTFVVGAIVCIGALSSECFGDELYAWGNPDIPVVTELPAGRDFVKVSAQGGSEYGWGLALRSNGTIVAWGVELEGRIAETPTTDGFVDVGTSEWGGLALRSDGTIVVWGDDSPSVAPPTGNDFVAIAAGRTQMLALRSDGTIEAWGMLIKGNITDTPTDGPFVAITTGRDASLALRADGTIAGWGDGIDRLPAAPADGDFVKLALGSFLAAGIGSDGSLRAWGPESELLTEVPAGNDFVAVDIGAAAAIALRADGTLVSWGYDRPISTVPTGNGFTAISVDYEEDAFVIALVDTGTQEEIENVVELVDELITLGAVLPADGNSLRAKLNAAIEALPEDTTTAIGSLNDFINQVKAFVRTGRLTPAQGQQLIAAAQAIIDGLSD